MSHHNHTWWKRCIAGAIGGAAGTAPMELCIKLSTKLGAPNPSSMPNEREHNMSLVARQHAERESSAQALAHIGYRKVMGREPDPQTKNTLSYVVHWGYGADMGGGYGLFRNGANPLIGGAAFGAAMFLVGDALVAPMLGLAEGPKAFPVSYHAEMLGAYMAYGLATAATTELIERLIGSSRFRDSLDNNGPRARRSQP